MNWKEWSAVTLLMAGCFGGLSYLIGQQFGFSLQVISSFVLATIGADLVKAANEHITAKRHE